METTEHAEPEWQTFRSQPAAFAHVRRIVHAFKGLIDEDVASQLCAETRFRDRLSAILMETYALSEHFGERDPSPAERRLALASGEEIEALVRQFGAVYWARAIVCHIEASAVVAVKEMLGDDAYAAAIEHRDLAGPSAELPANDELDGAVTSAGLRCMAAWCAGQPAGIGRRILLKLPDSWELAAPVAPPFDQVGARIVDRLLTAK